MKLLFISPAYEPAWSLGGVVACLSNLCRGLASMGHEVTFYTTNVDGSGQPMDVPVGTPVDLGGVRTFYFSSTFKVKDVRLRLFDSRALRNYLKKNRHRLRYSLCGCDMAMDWCSSYQDLCAYRCASCMGDSRFVR